jgi:hypothetical protein
MLDPLVGLELAHVPGPDATSATLQADHERASTLGRELVVHSLPAEFATELVRLARETQADLLILPRWSGDGRNSADRQTEYVERHAHCPVFIAVPPAIPEEAAAE